MSLLSEYSTLLNIIDNIAFLTDNETIDFVTNVYYYILYNYGDKTQSPLLTSGVDDATIANMINNKYKKLWQTVKDTSEAEIDTLLSYTDTETTHNNIYGYNSTTGVNDYETIKTIVKQYPDAFTNLQNAIAFFDNNVYYSIICQCIVNELTTKVFESEV